jgi:hypothetical protein
MVVHAGIVAMASFASGTSEHITTSSRPILLAEGLKDGLRLERNQLALAKITRIFLPTF